MDCRSDKFNRQFASEEYQKLFVESRAQQQRLNTIFNLKKWGRKFNMQKAKYTSMLLVENENTMITQNKKQFIYWRWIVVLVMAFILWKIVLLFQSRMLENQLMQSVNEESQYFQENSQQFFDFNQNDSTQMQILGKGQQLDFINVSNCKACNSFLNRTPEKQKQSNMSAKRRKKGANKRRFTTQRIEQIEKMMQRILQKTGRKALKFEQRDSLVGFLLFLSLINLFVLFVSYTKFTNKKKQLQTEQSQDKLLY